MHLRDRCLYGHGNCSLQLHCSIALLNSPTITSRWYLRLSPQKNWLPRSSSLTYTIYFTADIRFQTLLSPCRWIDIIDPKSLIAMPVGLRSRKAIGLFIYRSYTSYRVPSLIKRCSETTAYGTYHRSQSSWASYKPLETTPIVSQPRHPQVPLPPYRYPTAGLISYLPRTWVPYAELIRLDKPTGTYYLLFPCLFSTLTAANYSTAPLSLVATTSILFAAGAFVMRGAGCTINDLWDRNLDPYVNRTRLRPIARGAVTPFNAVAFTGVQLLAGLGILVQFPSSCFFYGIPSLLLVATYPLAKRVTHYPQVILGLTFSWGAIMGFPALGLDLLVDTTALKTAVALYTSCISWTVLYDMIYAQMDIMDDPKIGIKSIALRHSSHTKAVLSTLAFTQVSLLAAAGITINAGPVFFVGSCGSAAAALGLMVWKVNLKEVSSCWWWFKYGAWFTGGGITVGLLGDYLMALSRSKCESRSRTTASRSGASLLLPIGGNSTT